MPGGRGGRVRCWGVISRYVLTLYCVVYLLLHLLCPISVCIVLNPEPACERLGTVLVPYTTGALIELVVAPQRNDVGVVIVRRVVRVIRDGGPPCVVLVLCLLLVFCTHPGSVLLQLLVLLSKPPLLLC